MKRSLSVIVLATTAVAAVLAVPAAASAHTDDLFTWVYGPENSDAAGFATASKTTAALSFLGTNAQGVIGQVTGLEVCKEVGYAVGARSLEEDELTPVIATWDHSTGGVLSGPTAITLDSEDIVRGVTELDTLDDCTVLTLATIDAESPYEAIIEVDPATGAATVVIALPVRELPLDWTGLATDSSGTTYIFYDLLGGPYSSVVDLETQSLGTLDPLQGLFSYFSENPSYSEGVDFDPDGTLWLVGVEPGNDEVELLKYPAGSDIHTAVPAAAGPLSTSPDTYSVLGPVPLAAEGTVTIPVVPPATPQLAATGSEAAGGIVVGAFLLAITGGMLIARRRRPSPSA